MLQSNDIPTHMDTEIELKFVLANHNSQPLNIASELDAFIQPYLEKKATDPESLYNAYYDTPEYAIREMDFGLRVRSVNGKSEQTVKTSGEIVGGLHKRPEYNVDIEGNQPNLFLFSTDIWPENLDLKTLQAEISPLFLTEFSRHTWHVSYDNCRFELVYDQGAISVDDTNVVINEIELELKGGDIRHLIKFSQLLTEKFSLRLSNDSKAARGYRLFQGQTARNKEKIKGVQIKPQSSVEDCYAKTLQHGLNYWQYHEAVFCERDKLTSLREMLKGVFLVRHALTLYQGTIPLLSAKVILEELDWLIKQLDWVDTALHIKHLTSKKGNFRKRIAQDPELIKHIEESRVKVEPESDTYGLFYSARYNNLILSLLSWTLEKGWRYYSDTDTHQISLPVSHIASKLNQTSWDSLRNAVKNSHLASEQDFIELEKSINSGLLTGVCVGGLFESQERNDFRAPWFDILQGIDELKTFKQFEICLSTYDNEDEADLRKWHNSKVTNLISALNKSFTSAIKATPYW